MTDTRVYLFVMLCALAFMGLGPWLCVRIADWRSKHRKPRFTGGYAAKCKRLRFNGEATPCYCCEGECVGEPKDEADNIRLCREAEQRIFGGR